MGGTVTQLVKMLPHNIRDPDLILTLGAVYVEFTHPPCDHVLQFPSTSLTCASLSVN